MGCGDVDIVDIHCHLGDILYPGGSSVIGEACPPVRDPFTASALRLYHRGRHLRLRLASSPQPLARTWELEQERVRNSRSSLYNLQSTLDLWNIRLTACMPVAPCVTFENLEQAARVDDRIVPFTSIDFTLDDSAVTRVMADVERGARGLKLHPILQCRRLGDPIVRSILDAWQTMSSSRNGCLPVLLHAGVAHYYFADEAHLHKPEYGTAQEIIDLVMAYPLIPFILGHSGLRDADVLMRALGGRANIWVDTSFQPSGVIRRLIESYGEERVMYASDWPWGFPGQQIASVRQACNGDEVLEAKVLGMNARNLLSIAAD